MGWVSLDKRDNQPALFFGYLIAALQTVLPEAGSEALAILKLPGADLEEVVTLLVNALIVAPSPSRKSRHHCGAYIMAGDNLSAGVELER